MQFAPRFVWENQSTVNGRQAHFQLPAFSPFTKTSMLFLVAPRQLFSGQVRVGVVAGAVYGGAQRLVVEQAAPRVTQGQHRAPVLARVRRDEAPAAARAGVAGRAARPACCRA